MNEPRTLTKDRRHDHFWIENGVLFESYHTIRGLRYREVMSVPGLKDTERCSAALIEYIEEKYLNNNH